MTRISRAEVEHLLGVRHGRVGTHSEFFSSGPHGESSLAAQHKAAQGNPSFEVAPGVTMDRSDAEAQRLAREEGGCLRVDEDGNIIGTLRPGDPDPVTGEVCQGRPIHAKGPAPGIPASGIPDDPTKAFATPSTHKTSTTTIALIAGGALIVGKALKWY